MATYQQDETLSYFDRVWAEWRAKAEGKLPRVNVTAQRNACVHRVHEFHPRLRSMMDVGCGTGELVLEMAAKGVNASGIDFAPAMIRACEEKKNQVGARNATFHCASVFDYQAEAESQDLISALGFIEYISPEQLYQLTEWSCRVLRRGGFVVLGSRNRIFNLHSMNEFTRMEMSLGTVDRLLQEAIDFSTAETPRAALKASASSGRELPQPESHPGTGIDVAVRYQYTPGEIARLMRSSGFKPFAVYPVHFHAMPPSAVQGLHNVHVTLANRLFEGAPEDHRLIPYSSTFVMAAVKL